MIPVSQPHLVQVRSFDNPSTLRLVSLSNRRAGLRTIPSALITVATSGKDYSLVCSTDFRPATPRSIQHPRWYRALTIAENGRTESTRKRTVLWAYPPLRFRTVRISQSRFSEPRLDAY
jgi:hypothetical protein